MTHEQEPEDKPAELEEAVIKKELFKASGVSQTIMNIRTQLKREHSQVKNMLFLK